MKRSCCHRASVLGTGAWRPVPFNPNSNKKMSVMLLYKFLLNRTSEDLRRLGVTEGVNSWCWAAKGCVTLAKGQSGRHPCGTLVRAICRRTPRSQLLGNTLGTLTLACRWEGDPSNTSLHGVCLVPPLEVLRTWGSSGILGMEPQRSFLLASGDTLHAECNPSSP